jgi:PAS domain-containing protein
VSEAVVPAQVRASAREHRSTGNERPVVRQSCPLEFSWALGEQARHFELGHVLNGVAADAVEPSHIGAVGVQHVGLWECDLADDRLVWSGGTYDLFGLERGTAISRRDVLALYSEDSRATVERLRDHAIRTRCGFTVDVKVRAAAVGEVRQLRVIGAPICEGGRPVRLHGLKLIR